MTEPRDKPIYEHDDAFWMFAISATIIGAIGAMAYAAYWIIKHWPWSGGMALAWLACIGWVVVMVVISQQKNRFPPERQQPRE